MKQQIPYLIYSILRSTMKTKQHKGSFEIHQRSDEINRQHKKGQRNSTRG